MISNDNTLEKMHKKLGIEYVSRQKNGQFNDSEALIYDIAQYLEGQVDELTARGSIAFIIIKRNKDGKPVTLFFGRNNGNPLKIKKTKHSLTLSSQGEGKDIEPNKLYSYDYETGELKSRYLYIPYYSSSYSGFSNKNYGRDYGYSGRYVSNDGYDYGSYDSSGNYCRPSWDDEEKLEREQREFEENGGYGVYTNVEPDTIIKQGDFVPRNGTQDKIERDLLMEAEGDYEDAALAALAEAEDCANEQDRINQVLYTALTDEIYQELSDYWYTLNAYMTMMKQIYLKFERASIVVVAGGDKEQVEKSQTLLPIAS